MTAAFDTLAFSKKLRAQFTPEQAEALAEALVAGVDEELATKTDLKELDLRIDTRFAQLETRIAESANKTIVWVVGAIFSSVALVIAVLKFTG